MANIPSRYPLSTADGKSIPLDAVRPHSFLPLNVTIGAGSAAQQIPAGIELFTIMATADCYIRFYEVPSVVGDLTPNVGMPDTLFIPAGLLTVICPPLGKPYISARSISNPLATIYIQFLESWTGLTLQSQINRR